MVEYQPGAGLFREEDLMRHLNRLLPWLMETLNKWLRGRIAAKRGARSLAYLLDMSRSLRSVRLALPPARRFLQRFLIIAFLCQMRPAQAGTATELAAMPPYCAGRHARNTNMEEYKRWEAQYGPSFLHVHHLCDALAH